MFRPSQGSSMWLGLHILYIYVCVCVYMYICYILIHIYHVVCDYEITQAMQFVETSFYLALLHQHKFTKLY